MFAYRGSFYVGEDGAPKYLEKKSCIWNKPNIIVGKPRMIEFVDRYGFYNTMEIITMSTAITLNELEEMASEFITYGYDEEYYSEREDVVKRKKRVYFKGFMIGEEFEKCMLLLFSHSVMSKTLVYVSLSHFALHVKLMQHY